MATDLKLDDLRAFCAVVDHGSITAAARHLREGKGTVSKRISRLEEALDVTLLERQSRRARPTDEGLVYRREVGQALGLLEDATATLRRLQSEPRGHLRVTSVPGFPTAPLGRAVAAFREVYPGITVELLFTNELLSFERHDIDCAIRGVSGRLADSSLIATPLTPFRPALLASPAYLERAGTPTHPTHLSEHTFLLPPIGGPTARLVLSRGDDTVELTVEAEVRSFDTHFLYACALAGGGIAVTVRDLAHADLQAGRVVSLLDDWEVQSPGHLYLVHSGRPVTPKVRLFKPFVLEAFADKGASLPLTSSATLQLPHHPEEP